MNFNSNHPYLIKKRLHLWLHKDYHLHPKEIFDEINFSYEKTLKNNNFKTWLTYVQDNSMGSYKEKIKEIEGILSQSPLSVIA